MTNNNLSQEVTEYIQQINQEWQIEICNGIRKIIHQSVPDINEKIAMTTPNYSKNGKPLCTFFAAKAWVTLTIFNTKNFEMPEGFFHPSDHPDRMQVKIKKGNDLDEVVLSKLFRLVGDSM
ncbi:DUF1801 domain-containing protein [Cohnella silvisoli]|uniref:DUF1801 domain-containing protein n=1 Tax=Cohnella silvisoli TaxID=2873699 RepID=A0ABV1L3F2_9BACL|nr:DUF1801 domain-containing protein [Cohnella silvisoli]MCD9021633.1 DUF1801 domain-containing protein [Cohnella silvisoli]